MAYALGIDVGTTFTAAATWEAGRASVLPLAQRSDAVPSVLYLPADGAWLVGESAERRALTEPDQVARGFKRRLGDDVPIRLGDRAVSAVDLTAGLIRWVVELATQRQGGPPADVTLTVPAEWGSYRAGLMREAATAAGLPAVDLPQEPVGAAVYYGAQGRMAQGQTVGVFDLGGGTFDAALVRRTLHGYDIVGKPAGDPSIGGLDLDDEVMGHVRRALAEQWAAIDPDDPDTLAGLAALRAQVVSGREALSDDVETTIGVLLPGLVRSVRLTRPEFESLASSYVDRAIGAFSAMLTREKLTPADLGSVLLVGGTSRMPLVSERLTERLGRPVLLDAHPKYAVCLGAAMLAGARMTQPASVVDRGGLESPQQDRPRTPVSGRPAHVPSTVASRPTVAAQAPAATGRQSRLSIAADLAQAGLLPSAGGVERSDGRAMTQSPGRGEPLVVRTQRRSPSLAPVIAAAVVAVTLIVAVWLLVTR